MGMGLTVVLRCHTGESFSLAASWCAGGPAGIAGFTQELIGQAVSGPTPDPQSQNLHFNRISR